MWEDLYAELSNKIRWAISTSVAAQFNLPFRECQAIARPLAHLVVEGLKLKDDAPDLSLSGWIDQELAEKPLDNKVI